MRLMRNLFRLSGVVCLALFAGSCDWTSGGDDGFNTSGGAANINISGAYQGIISGRAVSNTSGAPIADLTIQQSGNVVEVRDSNGSNYRGTIGSPNTLLPAGSSTLSAGQQIASFQISWAGRDGVAQKDVEFTGVITAITVSDIQGRTRNTTSSNASDTDTTTTTTTSQGRNETQTDDATGQSEIDETLTEVTATVTDSSGGSVDQTSTTTFEITRENAQNNLRGTWVEIGGVSARVDAIAPTAGGTITTN